MLNRGAVVVRPKRPYLEWAAGLDDSGLVPDADGERTVYLIPGFESDEDGWAILAEAYESIFENELWGWHTDEVAWPQERSLEMFKAWFYVELHSLVEDLCAYEITDDEAE